VSNSTIDIVALNSNDLLAARGFGGPTYRGSNVGPSRKMEVETSKRDRKNTKARGGI
jgi:hypothetical protein